VVKLLVGLFTVFLYLLPNTSEARTPVKQDVSYEIAFFEEKCGYKLGDELEQFITVAYMAILTDTDRKITYYSFDVDLKIKLQKKQVTAKMYFRCGIIENEEVADREPYYFQSPSELIHYGDTHACGSDTRCKIIPRVMDWERPFNATNWKAKIGFTSSKYNNEIYMEFIICPPESHNSMCFGLNITDKTKLTPTEANTIVRLLETITYIPEVNRIVLNGGCLPEKSITPETWKIYEVLSKTPIISKEIPDALQLVEKMCGYRLGNSIEQTITTIQIKVLDNLHYFNVLMKIKLPKKPIYSVMGFVCEPQKNSNICPKFLSPSQFIIDEDSSGRYGREIEWVRPFNAINWKGRVAFVNSIFGDGQKGAIENYFLICPTTHYSICLPLQVTDGTQLNPTEIKTVLRLLETITYVPEAER
jgi:hypothetical protein